MNHKGTLTLTEQITPRRFRVCCDCGNEFIALASRWNRMTGIGCGKCFRSRMFNGRNNPKYKHGGNTDNKLEMNSYRGMIMRCYYPKYRAYHRYGARGIKVCERWLGENGFINFLSDMGKKPTAKHSIDRIDGDGNYEPENCKWATQIEQTAHFSRSHFVTIGDRTQSVTSWERQFKLPHGTFHNRVKKGWSESDALTTPRQPRGTNQTNSLHG